MLHLLNTYLLSLNLRILSPRIWNYLKDQLTYPESELETPLWKWLFVHTYTTKKQLFISCPDNSFEHWINTNVHAVPLTTYSLTDQQAKDIISFLRENKDYLQ